MQTMPSLWTLSGTLSEQLRPGSAPGWRRRLQSPDPPSCASPAASGSRRWTCSTPSLGSSGLALLRTPWPRGAGDRLLGACLRFLHKYAGRERQKGLCSRMHYLAIFLHRYCINDHLIDRRMSRRMTGNKHLPWIKMFLAIPSPNDMQGRSFSSVISFDRGQRTDNFSVCFAEAYRCGWKDLRSTQKINILNYIHCLSKLNNCVTQGCFHIRPQFASQT
ncbi:uncharacterized protein isoform X1 [Castor canadensis]|uniref:Uncharacterized protein isoform X1 n=1 Tax=Castor canadensis TaxID=51338 RepID=A0AC58KEH7_CASCN